MLQFYWSILMRMRESHNSRHCGSAVTDVLPLFLVYRPIQSVVNHNITWCCCQAWVVSILERWCVPLSTVDVLV